MTPDKISVWLSQPATWPDVFAMLGASCLVLVLLRIPRWVRSAQAARREVDAAVETVDEITLRLARDVGVVTE